METVIWIIVVIIWLFISSKNKSKKQQEKQKRHQQPLPPVESQDTKQPETLKDIFEQMRRQLTEVNKQPEQQPQYPTIKSILEQKKNQPARKQKPITNKQIVLQDSDFVTEQEKQSSLEYKKFVEKTRKKEHDAVRHQLDKKIIEVTDDTRLESLPIDLKNIIIADAVFRRPEY